MQQTLTIRYQQLRREELTPADEQLLQAAIQATGQAYAPYSHFSVGAALLLASGQIVTGSNQENIAYPSGLCAERTAMFAAASQHSGVPFQALAIAARRPDGTLTGVTPCGACRQVMAEYEKLHHTPLHILLYDKDDKILVFDGVESLLPFIFTM